MNNFGFSVFVFVSFFIMIKTDDQIISLSLIINNNLNYPLIPIKIENTEIKVMFISTFINSTNNMVISSKDYNPDDSKCQNKTGLYYYNFTYLINGEVYKNNIIFDKYLIKDIDFIYGKNDDINIEGGIIHFTPQYLIEIFKQNISYKSFSYSELNNENLSITLGENYDNYTFGSYDICDLKINNNTLLGCILEKIIISNSTKDFVHYRNIKEKEIKLLTEFDYTNLYNKNFIEGPENKIKEIKNFLISNGFNCSDNGTCISNNKKGYLIFGFNGIEFNKLNLKINNIDHLIFHGNAIENLKLIYDFERNKTILYCDDVNIIVSYKKPKPWVFIAILFGIFFLSAFFLLSLRKNESINYDIQQNSRLIE